MPSFTCRGWAYLRKLLYIVHVCSMCRWSQQVYECVLSALFMVFLILNHILQGLQNSQLTSIPDNCKGLARYCKAETTFTFHFSILTLSSAFLSINNREMKSKSGFSLVIASQPFQKPLNAVETWSQNDQSCFGHEQNLIKKKTAYLNKYLSSSSVSFVCFHMLGI